MIKEDTAYVLIDLRNPQQTAKGFIKGSVSIPAAGLAKSKDLFPSNKMAPIILADETQASEELFSTVRGWGYVNTSVLRGGISAWKGELLKGPLSAKIEYVKKLKPGEIAIEEFKSIASKQPLESTVLDVREGATEGRLPGALAIPNNELEARIAEIPREKDVVIYCNTGILSKMAYGALKEKGYRNVRYLNAVMQIAKDGSYEISEK
ncbi:MAG TPA: rhodanese-like domain-containing protein [Thermodesulfovibrionales bacterium]|nr:rhodanese-like domain-containing protein [Thermodesulfovibrionales bacterium]